MRDGLDGPSVAARRSKIASMPRLWALRKPLPSRRNAMTSQGNCLRTLPARGQAGQLFHAEFAARELGRLDLVDALDLAALIAADDPARYECGRRLARSARLRGATHSCSPRSHRHRTITRALAILSRIGRRAAAGFR